MWLSLKPKLTGGAGCRELQRGPATVWPCDAPGLSSVPLCSCSGGPCPAPGGFVRVGAGGSPEGEKRPPHEASETQGRLSPKSARPSCSRKPASCSRASLLQPGAFCFPGRAASHPPAHAPLAFSQAPCVTPTGGCRAQSCLIWGPWAAALPSPPLPGPVLCPLCARAASSDARGGATGAALYFYPRENTVRRATGRPVAPPQRHLPPKHPSPEATHPTPTPPHPPCPAARLHPPPEDPLGDGGSMHTAQAFGEVF